MSVQCELLPFYELVYNSEGQTMNHKIQLAIVYTVSDPEEEIKCVFDDI